MPDQVQAYVDAVLHAREDGTQRLDRGFRDLRDTGLETDIRHEARKLHRLQRILHGLARLDRVTDLGVHVRRMLRPALILGVRRQVPLHRLAQRRLVDVGCPGRLRRENQSSQQQVAKSHQGVHCPASLACSGGPPSRQKISGSMTSS